MKLDSIKVNGEELPKEQIADLFVYDGKRGPYVKGLDKYDDVIVSVLLDGQDLDLKFEEGLTILNFESLEIPFIKRGVSWSSVMERLKEEPFPVKFLFGVTDRVGYDRLFFRGFAYFLDGKIDYEADDFNSEWLLREEVRNDKDLKVND